MGGGGDTGLCGKATKPAESEDDGALWFVRIQASAWGVHRFLGAGCIMLDCGGGGTTGPCDNVIGAGEDGRTGISREGGRRP